MDLSGSGRRRRPGPRSETGTPFTLDARHPNAAGGLAPRNLSRDLLDCALGFVYSRASCRRNRGRTTTHDPSSRSTTTAMTPFWWSAPHAPVMPWPWSSTLGSLIIWARLAVFMGAGGWRSRWPANERLATSPTMAALTTMSRNRRLGCRCGVASLAGSAVGTHPDRHRAQDRARRPGTRDECAGAPTLAGSDVLLHRTSPHGQWRRARVPKFPPTQGQLSANKRRGPIGSRTQSGCRTSAKT